jgi:SAM-dependent methyltransferase
VDLERAFVSDLPVQLPASDWVRRFAPLVRPGGRVLDVAGGGGRHTALFLDRGHEVTVVDRDVGGLEWLAERAGCQVVQLDLEDGRPWALGGGWDAIVVTNYLHRPLFPALPTALAPGGVILYETFAMGNERFGRPSNPAFLLRPNELLEAFADELTVVAFEQGIVEHPRPAVVQRVAAMRSEELFPLL